ncbi:MAG TPA: histidine--tRNA ligase [Chitinophagales bacterium]|nr:histidine--tRNA ligase [Chitinophagales bacterium]
MSEVKKIKPALSKGTRDFLPSEVAKRNYIFDTIKTVFRKYGFEQIETPAIEKLETLTGKYGEEGDKLLFKILNSGDYLNEVRSKKIEADSLTVQNVTPLIAEKGLRYDLTVPLARYVVQHQDDLAFPFKRFHIGPVWRADRPQKGRYQEFYQCDADVIGSTSLFNEVELTKIYMEVYALLGVNATIRVNNRKILEALTKYAGCAELLTEITIVIDKFDKVGLEGVSNELDKLSLSPEQKGKITTLLQVKTTAGLKQYFTDIEIGRKGLDELNFVLAHANATNVVFDVTLARGLNYYTGTIWEVVCNDIKIGSIASGGRYDNLTEMFGGQGMSGVGISFGIERIYDVMEELKLFPATISQGVKVLFVPRDISVEEFTFQQVQKLRGENIPAEIFLGNVKKQKQFDYVAQKNIPYLVEIGDNEKNTGLFRLRDTQTRETRNDLTLEDISDLITGRLPQ